MSAETPASMIWVEYSSRCSSSVNPARCTKPASVTGVDANLKDPVDGYLMLNPGVNRKQGEVALEQIRVSKARFGMTIT